MELAERACVGIVTIRQLEAGVHAPRRSTLDVVKRALEAAGVEFIDENGGGAGVRLRKAKRSLFNAEFNAVQALTRSYSAAASLSRPW